MRVPRQTRIDGLRAVGVAARQLSFEAATDALFVTSTSWSRRC
jgi:hypothetical protein